jgi:hypothetical protein
VSRDLARILRWRHPGFRRRRLPHVWCVLRQPFRLVWWYVTHPAMTVFIVRLRLALSRAVPEGDTVMVA